jgi:RNA polymerase sigma factor (sigma-70 family)
MRVADDTDCSPERLVRLLRKEDPSALDHITRCYGDRLLAAGKRHCRTADEAEDAVQDALTTVAADLGQFRGEGSLDGWLIRIVANACRRISRGQKNDPARHDYETVLGNDEPSPETQTAGRELGELLQTALLDIESVDRVILLLAEVEQWTAPEIAERVGLTAGAVRTRLTRVRGRLRQALTPYLTEMGIDP